MSAYITSTEYNAITGRLIGEATSARLLRASQLLDARIGVRYAYDETTGRKLDLTTLPLHKTNAVKAWVAWMVAALAINADSPAVNESVTLGRFTLQAQNTGSRQPITLPDEVVWADEVLRDVSLINRSVSVSGRGNERWGGIL